MKNKPIDDVKKLSQDRIATLILKVIQGATKGIVYSLEAKDEYSHQHSSRVAEMSKRFSTILNDDKVKNLQIYLAGSIHDIGKIGIPDSVLLCPNRLSFEQWTIMKTHPSIGADIVTKTAESLKDAIQEDGFSIQIPSIVIKQIDEIRNGILHHHERYDGKGYPDGLVKEEIPYISRIIALCDSTDAMMSKRVYRNALSKEVCIEEIRKNSGIMYDPQLVKVFVEHFEDITKDMFDFN